MQFRTALTFAAALLASSVALAEEFKLKDLVISEAYARATMPQQRAGGAFVTIENKGKEADKLVGASTPVAKSVELHTMVMDNNVMKMREVSNIELKSGSTLVMKPGDGYHLMLMGLQKPLKEGDKFPITLNFEKSGKTEVTAVVRNIQGGMQGGMHGGGMQGGMQGGMRHGQ
ncbi:hypothetical protein GCM10027343_09060 [Noviherbaspirillum agri]